MKANTIIVDGFEMGTDPELYVGKRVSVTVSAVPFNRSSFHPQVSVVGTLERKPFRNAGDRAEYRVMTDDSNYSYFTQYEVAGIVAAEGHVFKNASVAVIYLNIGLGCGRRVRGKSGGR